MTQQTSVRKGKFESYGYLPGSTRVDSHPGFYSEANGTFTVHQNSDNCHYFDIAGPWRVYDIYTHPEVDGEYAIDVRSMKRGRVKRCSYCLKALARGNTPKKRPTPEQRREYARARYARLHPESVPGSRRPRKDPA